MSEANCYGASEFIHVDVFNRKQFGIDPVIAAQGSLLAAQEIVETVFKPLLQNCHFEAFFTHALATLGLLNEGLLLNIREVEASLTAKNHVRPCCTKSGYAPVVSHPYTPSFPDITLTDGSFHA